MGETSSPPRSDGNDRFETIYDVCAEPPIVPPSSGALKASWFISIISTIGFVAIAVFFYLGYGSIKQYMPWILILFQFLVLGILFGPMTSHERETAPDRRRQQLERQQILSSGGYSVTCGVGVYGMSRAGRMAIDWVKVDSIKIYHCTGGLSRLSGAYLRVSHLGTVILRVERRLPENAQGVAQGVGEGSPS